MLEAYRSEEEYGRTIETYRGELPGETSLTVDFLRLGRLALYYRTLDGEQCGRWQNGGWETLDSGRCGEIRKGVRIAGKRQAPDLLLLPLPAAVGGGQ